MPKHDNGMNPPALYLRGTIKMFSVRLLFGICWSFDEVFTRTRWSLLRGKRCNHFPPQSSFDYHPRAKTQKLGKRHRLLCCQSSWFIDHIGFPCFQNRNKHMYIPHHNKRPYSYCRRKGHGVPRYGLSPCRKSPRTLTYPPHKTARVQPARAKVPDCAVLHAHHALATARWCDKIAQHKTRAALNRIIISFAIRQFQTRSKVHACAHDTGLFHNANYANGRMNVHWSSF